MNFKPQNLYISVIDLFSIFIPGGIATIVLYHNFGDFIKKVFVIDETNTNYSWAILLLYSYLFGHVIFRMGSLIDKPIYDRWKNGLLKGYRDGLKEIIKLIWINISFRKKQKNKASEKNDDEKPKVKLELKYIPEIKKIRASYDAKEIKSNFEWSHFYLINSGSAGIDEVNRKMADSKFFRSLFIISLLLMVLYPARSIYNLVSELILYKDISSIDYLKSINYLFLFALSILLSIFSYYSYLELRMKASKLLYKHVIFLEAMKRKEQTENQKPIQ